MSKEIKYEETTIQHLTTEKDLEFMGVMVQDRPGTMLLNLVIMNLEAIIELKPDFILETISFDKTEGGMLLNVKGKTPIKVKNKKYCDKELGDIFPGKTLKKKSDEQTN